MKGPESSMNILHRHSHTYTKLQANAQSAASSNAPTGYPNASDTVKQTVVLYPLRCVWMPLPRLFDALLPERPVDHNNRPALLGQHGFVGQAAQLASELGSTCSCRTGCWSWHSSCARISSRTSPELYERYRYA